MLCLHACVCVSIGTCSRLNRLRPIPAYLGLVWLGSGCRWRKGPRARANIAKGLVEGHMKKSSSETNIRKTELEKKLGKHPFCGYKRNKHHDLPPRTEHQCSAGTLETKVRVGKCAILPFRARKGPLGRYGPIVTSGQEPYCRSELPDFSHVRHVAGTQPSHFV